MPPRAGNGDLGGKDVVPGGDVAVGAVIVEGVIITGPAIEGSAHQPDRRIGLRAADRLHGQPHRDNDQRRKQYVQSLFRYHSQYPSSFAVDFS